MKKVSIVIAIAAVFIPLVAGAYLGGKYFSKGEMVMISCVLGEVAVAVK